MSEPLVKGDIYTLAHFVFGVWAGDRKWSVGKLLVAHTAWEFFECYVCEPHFRRILPGVFYHEPLSDRVGDTLAASAG